MSRTKNRFDRQYLVCTTLGVGFKSLAQLLCPPLRGGASSAILRLYTLDEQLTAL